MLTPVLKGWNFFYFFAGCYNVYLQNICKMSTIVDLWQFYFSPFPVWNSKPLHLSHNVFLFMGLRTLPCISSKYRLPMLMPYVNVALCYTEFSCSPPFFHDFQHKVLLCLKLTSCGNTPLPVWLPSLYQVKLALQFLLTMFTKILVVYSDKWQT